MKNLSYFRIDFFKFHLRRLESTKENPQLIKLIKMILDENSDQASFIHETANMFSKVLNEAENEDYFAMPLELNWFLGICYQFGLTSFKPKNALESFESSAALGHAPSQYMLGTLYGTGIKENNEIIVQKDLKKSFSFYKQAADNGSAEAQDVLGHMYLGKAEYLEYSIKKDIKKGLEFFNLASEQGYAPAKYEIAMYYGIGNPEAGIQKDEKVQADYLEQAANLDYAKAEYSLGICYQLGQGRKQNASLALKFQQRAAEHRFPGGLVGLGVLKLLGMDGVPDIKCTEEYFQTAIKINLDGLDGLGALGTACQNLGAIYTKEFYLAKNLKRAILLYQAMAELGVEHATNTLQNYGVQALKDGILYIPPLKEALSFYQKRNDMVLTGFAYQMGLGTPQDLTQAVTCYKEAIQEGQAECYWDLYLCLRMMQWLGMDKVREYFKELYVELQLLEHSDKTKTSFKSQALQCLGFFYEHGAPHFKTDIFKAFECYQKAASIDDSKYIFLKFCDYSHVHAHMHAIDSANKVTHFPTTISELITQYSIEPRKITILPDAGKENKNENVNENSSKKRKENLTPLRDALRKCMSKKDNLLPIPELALRRAAADSKIDIAEKLIEIVNDLDINQPGASGETALMWAEKSKSDRKGEMVSLLKKHMNR